MEDEDCSPRSVMLAEPLMGARRRRVWRTTAIFSAVLLSTATAAAIAATLQWCIRGTASYALGAASIASTFGGVAAFIRLRLTKREPCVDADCERGEQERKSAVTRLVAEIERKLGPPAKQAGAGRARVPIPTAQRWMGIRRAPSSEAPPTAVAPAVGLRATADSREDMSVARAKPPAIEACESQGVGSGGAAPPSAAVAASGGSTAPPKAMHLAGGALNAEAAPSEEEEEQEGKAQMRPLPAPASSPSTAPPAARNEQQPVDGRGRMRLRSAAVDIR